MKKCRIGQCAIAIFAALILVSPSYADDESTCVTNCNSCIDTHCVGGGGENGCSNCPAYDNAGCIKVCKEPST